MKVLDLGVRRFEAVWRYQQRIAGAISRGNHPETLLLVEHPSVYTTGRTGSPENLLADFIKPVYINRGGDVTWHGPGQIVAYPLLHLGRRGGDLHRYLRFLEEVIISVLEENGITGRRREGLTGVWTDGGKIASIGIGVRRWVSLHGIALNVSNDISPFRLINPCGMACCPIATMSRELGREVPVHPVKQLLTRKFTSLLPLRLPAMPQDVRASGNSGYTFS